MCICVHIYLHIYYVYIYIYLYIYNQVHANIYIYIYIHDPLQFWKTDGIQQGLGKGTISRGFRVRNHRKKHQDGPEII